MLKVKRIIAAVFLGIALTTPMASFEAEGQQVPQPMDFSTVSHDLDWASQVLDGARLEQSDLDAVRTRIRSQMELIGAARAKAQNVLETKRDLLEAIGPAPKVGEPVESAEIADQRVRLESAITEWEGQIKQADLLLERAETLIASVNAATNRLKAEGLLTRYPSPLSTKGRESAMRGLTQLATTTLPRLADSALHRVESLTEPKLALTAVSLSVAALLLLLPFGLRLRRDAPGKAGKNENARASALYAVRQMLLGYLPAAAGIGAVWLAANRVLDSVAIQPYFTLLLGTIIAVGLLRAPLVAARPHTSPISGGATSRLARRLTLLALLTSLQIFARLAADPLQIPDALADLIQAGLQGAEAIMLVLIVRGSIWRELGTVSHGRSGKILAPVRFLLDTKPLVRAALCLPLASPALTLLGFRQLAAGLALGVVGTATVLWIFWLLRGALREGYAKLIWRSRKAQNLSSGGRHVSRRRRNRLIHVIGTSLVDLGLALATLAGIIWVWGIDLGQSLDWISSFSSGVTIGSVRISLSTVATALAGFLLVLALTRIAQHMLDQRILRRARVDSGTRNSLRTGIGYVGVSIAILVGLLGIGIDLSKVALIAGALSIGLGFGLQTIANNFVSGLILLIERPVKVGDWVVVGKNEGIVKRISVRATEIETFHRSSVLVPNSELISQAVVNWTFKDHTGRLDVELMIRPEEDADALADCLEDIARRHPAVLTDPPARAHLTTGPEYELVLQLWAFISVRDSTAKFRVESEILRSILRKRRELRTVANMEAEREETVASKPAA